MVDGFTCSPLSTVKHKVSNRSLYGEKVKVIFNRMEHQERKAHGVASMRIVAYEQ